MKSRHFFLFLAVASLGVVARAEDKPAPKAAAKPAAAKAKATAAKANEADANEPRVKAMQEDINTSRQFANPSPEAAAWFGKLRAQRAASKDAEEQAALDVALQFDPAVPPSSSLGKEPLKNYPAPEVSSTLGKLAATERALDLGQKPIHFGRAGCRVQGFAPSDLLHQEFCGHGCIGFCSNGHTQELAHIGGTFDRIF